MARRRSLKQREYELCLEQQTLIEELRRFPDRFDVSSISRVGFGGGLGATAESIPMIGD